MVVMALVLSKACELLCGQESGLESGRGVGVGGFDLERWV